MADDQESASAGGQGSGAPPGGVPGAAGGGGGPKGPPFGTSPATQPTPNRGQEMAALQKLALVVRMLEVGVGVFGSRSPVGQDVLKALGILSKHVPPGLSTPASEQNQLQQLAMKNAQAGQQVAALRQATAQQGAGGGAPGGMPPGAAPGAG